MIRSSGLFLALMEEPRKIQVFTWSVSLPLKEALTYTVQRDWFPSLHIPDREKSPFHSCSLLEEL